MTTAVVVEIARAEESPSSARFLLDACNVGMHPGRCVLGRDAALDDDRAIAIVTWEGDGDSEARVEVGLRVRGRPQWQTRFLSFAPADPQGERWRTVGFAIATTVGEAEAREAVASGEARVAASPSPAVDEARAGGPSAPVRSWVDALLSMTAQGSSPGWGGELRFSSRVLGDRPFVFGAVGCSIEQTSLDGLSIVIPSAAAGAGLTLLRLPGRTEVAARAQGLLEVIDATATDPATGLRGSGQRWVAGLGEVFDASWMWSRTVGFVAGVGLVESIGPTDITAHGQGIAHISAVALQVGAGLRVGLP
jgi:hypothetical protein